LIVATLAAARAKRDAIAPPEAAASSTSPPAGGPTADGPAADPDSARTQELLDTVERSSRKALDELRSVLRVLDDEPGAGHDPSGDGGDSDGEYSDATAPWVRGALSPRVLQPRDVDHSVTSMVAEAAQDFHAIGNQVDIRLDPSLSDATVADGHAELMRRFLTEGVTNIVKHGGISAHVVMDVQSAPDTDRIRIRLCNSLGRAAAVSPRDSTGLGLGGLRKEAESNGCTVEAGPIEEGDLRWALALELPRESVVRPPTDTGDRPTHSEPRHNE